jgi:hypothetical protein
MKFKVKRLTKSNPSHTQAGENLCFSLLFHSPKLLARRIATKGASEQQTKKLLH